MSAENQISYPNVKQSWGIVGLIILSMVVFTPVSVILNEISGKDFSFFVYYVLAMGAAFWVVHLIRKKKTSFSTFNFDLSSGKTILLVFIAAVTLQTGIVSPMVSLVPMPDFMKKIFLEFAERKGVFPFITVVMAAPILEELIFRGIILDGLLKKYSPLKSILISSVLFGVVHLNPWQFIAALLIGSFSGWVYYKTRKLSLSILIHFANNLLSFMYMYFIDAEAFVNMSLTELYGGFFNLMLVVSGSIIVAALCLYTLKLEFEKVNTNAVSTEPNT